MNTAFAGMKIIANYDEDFDIEANHDEIFVRVRNGVSMSEIDQKKMKDFGWFYDEDYWHKFV